MKNILFFLFFVLSIIGCDVTEFVEEKEYEPITGTLEVNTSKWERNNIHHYCRFDRITISINRSTSTYPVLQDTIYTVQYKLFDFGVKHAPYGLLGDSTYGAVINHVKSIMSNEGYRPARIEEFVEYLILYSYPWIKKSEYNQLRLIALGSSYSYISEVNGKEVVCYPNLEKWMTNDKVIQVLEPMGVVLKDKVPKYNYLNDHTMYIGVK